MARPKIPLISRRKALEAALAIIDSEGLDALSIRRLADALGVNGASLYHHFANKDEIVVGATEIALSRVRTPTATDESWRSWLPRNSALLREAMLEHPQLVTIIVRKGELGMGMQMMDSSARRLLDEGVPLGAVTPLMDALEMFAIGSAIHESRGDAGDTHTLPADSALAEAAKSRALSADELYQIVSTAIVEAISNAVAAKPATAIKSVKSVKAAKAADVVKAVKSRGALKSAAAPKSGAVKSGAVKSGAVKSGPVKSAAAANSTGTAKSSARARGPSIGAASTASAKQVPARKAAAAGAVAAAGAALNGAPTVAATVVPAVPAPAKRPRTARASKSA